MFDDPSQNFMIIESEHNVLPASQRPKLVVGNGMQVDGEEEELGVEYFGLPRASAGSWASCIRLLDPLSGETSDIIELDNNEAAIR
jgi:splicing factor 3B subunit 3